jgi:hypothetical protein
MASMKKDVTEEVAAKIAPSKATVKKTPAKKAEKKVFVINAEMAGFKAGDVYNTLAAAEKPLSVIEIAKKAKISQEEVLIGMGWLFKEGKIKDDGELIALV